MKLTKDEKQYINQVLATVRSDEHVQRMRQYMQHGSITTYDHCERVARVSLYINRKLHLGARERDLLRGAMLHDLFLYDWHEEDGGSHRWHGFTHPETALGNARRSFQLTQKEEDIIANHMWPLTLRHMPRSREAFIVCMADKVCSLKETLFMR